MLREFVYVIGFVMVFAKQKHTPKPKSLAFVSHGFHPWLQIFNPFGVLFGKWVFLLSRLLCKRFCHGFCKAKTYAKIYLYL